MLGIEIWRVKEKQNPGEAGGEVRVRACACVYMHTSVCTCTCMQVCVQENKREIARREG